MSSLHMSTVCGGSFERGAWPLFRWGWRGRRGERGGGLGGWGGGGGRGGVRRNWASSGGTAAGGATGWRVRWQGLEHTATPLLNRMLNKDRDRREFHCVVKLYKIFCDEMFCDLFIVLTFTQPAIFSYTSVISHTAQSAFYYCHRMA